MEKRAKVGENSLRQLIDKAYENMIANTPPTTEEERTHCEMIKEAVKGMFINESRTAREAEFIKTHIVDYEKIFDVCMNGDDLEFKKDLSDCRKCKMNMSCTEKMTDREKEAFIGGIEFARD